MPAFTYYDRTQIRPLITFDLFGSWFAGGMNPGNSTSTARRHRQAQWTARRLPAAVWHRFQQNDGGSYPTEGRITIGATPRVTRQSIDNLVYGVARGRGTEATIRYR